MPQDEAVIYCRASKDRTGAGVSVAGQEADCRKFAEQHGLTVRRVYADNDITASGRKIRPAYRRMLADLAEQPATVVIWHTDRLHRHPAELEEYIALAERHSIVTRAVRVGELDLATPSGRLVARMLGAAAKHELEIMSQRRRDAKARVAKAGEWKGGRRPFGYDKDGVTLVQAEAAQIASGADAILAGVSLAAVTREWNTSGLPTSTGRPWKPREVSRVLRRPRNAGLMEHQGKVIEGVRAIWPPAVSQETWRAVTAILSDPARNTSPGPERRHLLSGIAVCGICRRGLIVNRTAGKGRPMRPVYRCRPARGSGEHGHVARDVATLDAYVTGLVIDRLRHADLSSAVRPVAPAADAGAMHARTTAVRQRLDEAARLYADGAIDASQLTTINDTLNAELAAIGRQLAALAEHDALAEFTGRDPEQVWEGLPLARRRAVIAALMGIVVNPAPRGRPAGWQPGQTYFDKDSITIEWHR